MMRRALWHTAISSLAKLIISNFDEPSFVTKFFWCQFLRVIGSKRHKDRVAWWICSFPGLWSRPCAGLCSQIPFSDPKLMLKVSGSSFLVSLPLLEYTAVQRRHIYLIWGIVVVVLNNWLSRCLCRYFPDLSWVIKGHSSVALLLYLTSSAH